jgi:hypothetical protein
MIPHGLHFFISSFRGASETSEPGIHNHDREYGFRASAKSRIPEFSEIRQAVTRLGVEVVEPMRPFYKLNEVPAIPEAMLPIVPEYLNGRAYTIFGGSSEIQRDIVAKMAPGL